MVSTIERGSTVYNNNNNNSITQAELFIHVYL